MCRIYIDMDGTIAEYLQNVKIEDYHTGKHFEKLRPMWTMLNAVKILIRKGYDAYILSAVYMDGDAKEGKLSWLHEYLPELWEYYKDADKHIIFTPVGEDKIKFIDNPAKDDILLDDYTKNLMEWRYGIPVKCVNGINWNNGTWHGYSVDIRSDAEYIAKMIQGIALIECIPNKACA